MRATNRQMMEFFARGFGEWMYDRAGGCTGNQWSYHVGDENEECSESLRVRTWDTLEWSVPTKEYIEEILKNGIR